MERRILLLSVLLLVQGVIDVRGGDLMTTSKERCVCMNWRSCRGRINNDVPCPQSYVDVCCVIPSLTEPTPSSVEEKWEGKGDIGDKFVYEKILLTVVQ